MQTVLKIDNKKKRRIPSIDRKQVRDRRCVRFVWISFKWTNQQKKEKREKEKIKQDISYPLYEEKREIERVSEWERSARSKMIWAFVYL